MIYKINRYKLFRFKKYLNNMVNFKRMCFKRNGIIKLMIFLDIYIQQTYPLSIFKLTKDLQVQSFK